MKRGKGVGTRKGKERLKPGVWKEGREETYGDGGQEKTKAKGWIYRENTHNINNGVIKRGVGVKETVFTQIPK